MISNKYHLNKLVFVASLRAQVKAKKKLLTLATETKRDDFLRDCRFNCREVGCSIENCDVKNGF